MGGGFGPLSLHMEVVVATVGTLIARIEARMALAAGIDVQTVDEPRLMEMLRHKYNVVFDANWWYDYLTLEEFTTNGTTGVITGTVADKIRRFADIHSVFSNRDPNPLPLLTLGANPLLRNRSALAPFTSDATKMFKVYPIDTAATIQVWYRTRMPDEDWEEGDDDVEVNMDDELLIAGTVADYIFDDGSNPEAADKYLKMYQDRLDQLQKLQFQAPIAKRDARFGYPTEWTYGAP